MTNVAILIFVAFVLYDFYLYCVVLFAFYRIPFYFVGVFD